VIKLLNIFDGKRTLEERVKDIQQGDEDDKNNLIQEYIPFIKKVLVNQLGSYIQVENDDSFSVGLIAFNEAIEKYDGDRGNFLTFASMVIKSRLIDQFRKKSSRPKEVYINQFQREEDEDHYTENIMREEGFESGIEIKLDFASLVHKMKDFGVSLDDLIQEAPKHQDTRRTAIEIGTHVFENRGLCKRFLSTGNLPTNDIIRDLNVSRKVVQRSRKFIIAIILILNSDLDTLKGYISSSERGQSNDLSR